ncbi:cytochrome P450 [Myxococcota bacterium]|nr:cytochrome P450 [Myxococcota bacterium]
MKSTSIPIFEDLPTEPDTIVECIFDTSANQSNLVRLYHQLRNVAPVHQSALERLGQPWIVTRHEDAALVAREKNLIKDGRLVDQLGGDPNGPFSSMMKRMLNFIPAPRHTRLRQLVNNGFTLRSIERLRPKARKLIDQLLDEHLPNGSMDLVRDYSYRIPLAMICDLLGVPIGDTPKIEAWSGQILESVDEARLVTDDFEKRRNHAVLGFSEYFQSLINMRRAHPRDDLISRLVELQRSADDLSDQDIIATSILMFQAGHDTTSSLISKGVLALLLHPDQFSKLRQNPELISNATEELLRYDTSVQLSINYAISDIPYHDRVIREGESVIILRGAANRDPERFPDPDRLDIERPDIDHHSFGLGAHFCLGASLARLEIQEAVGALVRRIPNLQVDYHEVRHRPSLHLHGLASMPVHW